MIPEDLRAELPAWNNGAGVCLGTWVPCEGNKKLAAGYSTVFWPTFGLVGDSIVRSGVTPEVIGSWEKSCEGGQAGGLGGAEPSSCRGPAGVRRSGDHRGSRAFPDADPRGDPRGEVEVAASGSPVRGVGPLSRGRERRHGLPDHVLANEARVRRSGRLGGRRGASRRVVASSGFHLATGVATPQDPCRDPMRPMFTVHVGEHLVGDYMERTFPRWNVWVPSKDTGTDLLLTEAGRREGGGGKGWTGWCGDGEGEAWRHRRW